MLESCISVYLCIWQCCPCVCSHNKVSASLRAFWCVDDISVWWAELRSELSVVGVKGPLCGTVTGVNPKLSHQHPHGLLSLTLRQDTHVLQSGRGMEGKWSEERGRRWWGVRWRGKQDAAEAAAFCELSSHYWGFGKAQRMTALGTFFYFSPSLPGGSVFQTCICAADSGSEKPANKQYCNLQLWCCGVSLFPQLLPSPRGNDRLCHGYRACLWLVRRLSTISIRNPMAAGLITGP